MNENKSTILIYINKDDKEKFDRLAGLIGESLSSLGGLAIKDWIVEQEEWFEKAEDKGLVNIKNLGTLRKEWKKSMAKERLQ